MKLGIESSPLFNTYAILTLMSIDDEISHRIGQGRLTVLEPLFGPFQRVVALSERLYQDFSAALEAEETGERFGRLLADFHFFSRGGHVVVGRGKEKNCFLKLLEPPAGEVWELRSRNPLPSIRVFGRFAMKDYFIATNMEYRTKLGPQGSREWRDEIVGCAAQWRSLFPTYDAHTGADIHDYISEPVSSIGSFK